jgi:hypothetical protein
MQTVSNCIVTLTENELISPLERMEESVNDQLAARSHMIQPCSFPLRSLGGYLGT